MNMNNRKSTENQSLVQKIQTQLFQNKKNNLKQGIPNKLNLQSKKSTLNTSLLNNSQAKSRSSQKVSKKSDSFENLFNKKSDNLISKKKNTINQSRDKLHQSFSHQMVESHGQQRNATKSMYFTDLQNQNSIQQEQKKENSLKKNIKINDYFQKYNDLLNKCSNINKEIQINENRKNVQAIAHEFQDFKIDDVNSLIELIENCVQEANFYISDLSIKVQKLSEQLQQIRRAYKKLEQFNKNNIMIIKQKQVIIQRMKQQKNKKGNESKNQDIKNLSKIIEKLTDQNTNLKNQILLLKNKSQSQYKTKQMYHQIHKKIDILNIAIDQVPNSQNNNTQQNVVKPNQYKKNFKYIKSKN